MKMMELLIRPEQTSDYLQITKINDLAFGQPNEGRLVNQLRACNAFIPELSLVAVVDGAILGHILFSRSEVRGDNGAFEMLCLAPMSVLPDYQKHGIGSKLVETGLKSAKGLGHKAVNVLGHKDYYPRFGFVPASKWKIKAPFEVPDDVFMALELEDGALKNVRGIVQYAAPFSEV